MNFHPTVHSFISLEIKLDQVASERAPYPALGKTYRGFEKLFTTIYASKVEFPTKLVSERQPEQQSKQTQRKRD